MLGIMVRISGRGRKAERTGGVQGATIGDNVFLAPRVCIYTAGHPIDAGVRRRQLEYGKKAVIGNDVCVGGNTVIKAHHRGGY